MGGRDGCFTCLVAADPPRRELVAYRSGLVVVNHYHADVGEPDRTGWFVVAPVRHVRRWFSLTTDEQHALAEVTAAVDEALTVLLGARRSMVASLGWFTMDHVHVHVVPTASFPVTFGWENFGSDRYVPLGPDPVRVTEAVRGFLARRRK